MNKFLIIAVVFLIGITVYMAINTVSNQRIRTPISDVETMCYCSADGAICKTISTKVILPASYFETHPNDYLGACVPTPTPKIIPTIPVDEPTATPSSTTVPYPTVTEPLVIETF